MNKQSRPHTWLLFLLLFLLIIVSVAFGVVYRALQSEKEKNISTDMPSVRLQSFIHGRGAGVEEEKEFTKAKQELLLSGSKFIEADLEAMELRLYENGTSTKTFTIRTKGRDGSWWETPIGEYKVLSKEANHLSSIGNVWMPWSMQFYGNFFIHGWPYHDDGTPVPTSYSGGCIRLGTEDAKEVFSFAERNMPILVYEKDENGVSQKPIIPVVATTTNPKISAYAAFVADIDTGEVLFDKNAEERLPIASLTKLMTATVASELIFLERSVTISQSMLSAPIQSYPFNPGERYRAFDLLYPLLEESSNGAASALQSFLGSEAFVRAMNEKAASIQMKSSTFKDPAGISPENTSSLKDLAVLSKYILEKRKFIFDISRGKDYEGFTSHAFQNIKNFNEFSNDPRMIGVKNGETKDAGKTYMSVWELKDEKGIKRRIVIGFLRSEDRARDAQEILDWISLQFGLR